MPDDIITDAFKSMFPELKRYLDMSTLRHWSNKMAIAKNRWPEIKKAETDREIHSKLTAEFIDTFWPKPDVELREAAKGLF